MTQLQGDSAKNVLKHMRAKFVSGFLVLVPLAITIFVLRIIITALTGLVRPFLSGWTDSLPEYVIMVIAAVAAVCTIYVVGLITTHFVGRRLIGFGESLLLRLPIVKTVYAASKQMVETFSESTQRAFKAVVFVDFPRTGTLAAGFLTGTIVDPSNKILYSVFVPTTPNPTSGFLIILPEEDIRFTDISIEDGIRMIVSGGVLSPKRYGHVERLRDERVIRDDH